MKKSTKLVSVLFALILVFSLGLTACGGGDASDASTADDPATSGGAADSGETMKIGLFVKTLHNGYANQLRERGQFPEAARHLLLAGDYKDSLDLLAPIGPLLALDASQGDSVYLGQYPQSADGTTTAPIEWVVLEVREGKVLLISKDVLDAKSYDSSKYSIQWADCELREWLNTDFMDAAFTSGEQSYIALAELANPPGRPKSAGSRRVDPVQTNTEDHVFVLSHKEYELYELYFSVEMTEATEYAKKAGVTLSDDGYAEWTIRSSRDIDIDDAGEVTITYQSEECQVRHYNRELFAYRQYDTDVDGVRPALWLDVDSPEMRTLSQTGGW